MVRRLLATAAVSAAGISTITPTRAVGAIAAAKFSVHKLVSKEIREWLDDHCLSLTIV